MEVLTAYVRNSLPWEPKPSPSLGRAKEPPGFPEVAVTARPPADIQAILTVIGRRRTDYEGLRTDYEGRRVPSLDLARTNLGAANLSGVLLFATNLRATNLRGANLGHANLGEANLCNADLSGADLRHTNLCAANLRGANLDGADLGGADLSMARSVSQDQINAACLDEKTSLPQGITRPSPCPTSSGD